MSVTLGLKSRPLLKRGGRRDPTNVAYRLFPGLLGRDPRLCADHDSAPSHAGSSHRVGRSVRYPST